MFLVHPTITPEQMQGYAEAVFCGAKSLPMKVRFASTRAVQPLLVSTLSFVDAC